MKTSRMKMQSNCKKGHVNSVMWKSVFFCIFFTAAALSVAIFLPVETESEDNQIASISNDEFFLGSDVEIPLDFSPLSDVVESKMQEADRGLELYREARSKAAVEWFYLHITGNKNVTNAILKEANNNDIPLSLAFALAYVESRFKPMAVNKNTNSSVDRGLFQLNNLSFPKLTEEEFYDPDVSAKYGLQHLRYCLNLAGKEATALAMYNAGTVRVRKNNTPKSTLNYVDSIMRYKASLDEAFHDEIEKLYRQPEQGESVRVAFAK